CSSPANVGRFGNAGYDILSGPPLFDLDFGLSKDFRIGEHVRLAFTTTMVNVLNHPSFNQPDPDISDVGTVGTIGSQTRVLGGEPAYREIDLGLRLEF
ncbi:MAG: hypothetical protein ACRD2G_18035, partial [Terriglobia bacterium]